jgi:hypothetical protein
LRIAGDGLDGDSPSDGVVAGRTERDELRHNGVFVGRIFFRIEGLRPPLAAEPLKFVEPIDVGRQPLFDRSRLAERLVELLSLEFALLGGDLRVDAGNLGTEIVLTLPEQEPQQ